MIYKTKAKHIDDFHHSKLSSLRPQNCCRARMRNLSVEPSTASFHAECNMIIFWLSVPIYLAKAISEGFFRARLRNMVEIFSLIEVRHDT